MDFFVPGNARALVKFKGPGNEWLLGASQNRSWLKIFKSRDANAKIIPLASGDKEVHYTMANGKVRKEEVYYGHSFLSQSSRFICLDGTMRKIEIVNQKGQKRLVQ